MSFSRSCAPEEATDQHLEFLRWIAGIAQHEDFVSFCCQASSTEQVRDLLGELSARLGRGKQDDSGSRARTPSGGVRMVSTLDRVMPWVALVTSFDAQVELELNGRVADARSILAVMDPGSRKR